MVWIITIVILVLVVNFAGFRKFAGGLVLVGAIGGFIYYQFAQNEEKMSLKRVEASELVFADVEHKSLHGSEYLVGRVTNASETYTVTKVNLKVIFRDCKIDAKMDCIVIADTLKEMHLRIPPKQARDFKESLYFSSNTKANGKLVWSYNVVSVAAK